MSMNIFENPFYILGASTKDNRRKISDLAEEKGFLYDPDTVEEARNALIIPQKRLEAELRWFPNVSNEDLENIIQYIKSVQDNSTRDELKIPGNADIALLNTPVYIFQFRNFKNNAELNNYVSIIETFFEKVNTVNVYNNINDDRKASGFPVAEMVDIENEFLNYRSDIVKIISEKLSKQSKYDYIKSIEQLANEYNDEKIIYEDIIDDYTLRITSSLEEEKRNILEQVNQIMKQPHLASEFEFNDLCWHIKNWGDMVSPILSLAIKTKRRQVSFFDDNYEILSTVRKMALYLQKNWEKSEEALQTIKILKENIVKFSPNFSDILDEDIKNLEIITSYKKQGESIKEKLEQEFGEKKELTKKIDEHRPKLGLVSLGLIVLFIIWGIINNSKSSTSSKSYLHNNRPSQSSTSNRNYVPQTSYNTTNYNTSANSITYNQPSNNNIPIESKNTLLKDLEELKKREEQLKQIEVQEFPKPAVINGNKVNVRNNSNTSSKVLKQLNYGHPVSVSNRVSKPDGDWYYSRTASGTKGWVKGNYLTFKDQNLSYQELENRKKSLPATGEVNTIKLNVRDIPSLQSSKVIEQLNSGEFVLVNDIFTEEKRNWYHIRTNNYINGWVAAKHIIIYENSLTPFFQLSREYATNPFKAEKKWLGQTICIYGNILDINIEIDTVSIVLGGKDTGAYYEVLGYFFIFSEIPDTSHLHIGQMVTIQGTVRGFAYNPSISDALFIILDEAKVVKQ